MNAWRHCRTWNALLMAVLLLAACDARQHPTDQSSPHGGLSSSNSAAMTKNQTVTIKLGQSGEEFIRANGRSAIDVKREPAGLNFYRFDWPHTRPGTVRVEHGAASFEVQAMFGGFGTENTSRPQAGLAGFNFSGGITASNTILHLEARDDIMALLNKLQTAGWKRSITRSRARFAGAEAVRESIQQIGIYSLDPSYTPTPQEWMSLGEHAMWKLWANGAYLTIDLHRDTQRMDPNKPGAYFLSFDLHTEDQELRPAFLPQDRDRWRELWPEREKQLIQERAEAETKARAEGRTIDERYQDPPLMQPKTESTLNAKPEPKKQAKLLALPGDPCPQSGYWSAVALPGQRALVMHGDPMPGPKYGKTGAVIWSFEGPDRPA